MSQTEQTIPASLILTPADKRRRLLMMISGSFLILFTGFTHVWSLFQPYILTRTGWSETEASMSFYMVLAFFVLGNIVGGRIQDKGHPRAVLVTGGAIMAGGVLLSALACSIPSVWLMYLSYGFMQGTGQGMIYAVILPTAQKWFPDRLGFASGIIVASNGLCGLILSPVCSILLPAAGVAGAFLIIGSVIALAWIMNILFYCGPSRELTAYRQAARMQDSTKPGRTGQAGKKNAKKEQGIKVQDSDRHHDQQLNKSAERQTAALPRQYTTGEMLRTGRFYLLLFTMMFGLITYFMLSPVTQTYQAGIGISSAIAVSAVMFGSILNSAIRLILPAASDRFGRSNCIKAVLIAGTIALFLLSRFENYAVTLAIIIMYGCFGGIMGSFPAFTSSIFGLEHAGENYGCVMLGIVAASFGAPAVTAAITSAGGGMKTVFFISMLLEIAGLLCLIILERLLKADKAEN